MKITKSRLKQIIKEEIESDPALLKALSKLTGTIEELDVSIDFLSAAVVGGDPRFIGSQQKSMGRAYKPQTQDLPSSKLNEEDEGYSDIVCKELVGTLGELQDKIAIQKEKDALETQNQIDVLENIMVIKGCLEEQI